MRNNVGFTSDLVLKLIFLLNSPKNENFSHYSTLCLVQCCPEKSILMQKFWSWYLMERLLISAPLCEPQCILRSKNSTRLPVEN